jgi:hypothetical protein
LANLWYAKYPGVPDRGSPLETLFRLVALERKIEEIMATRALVLGAMADDSRGAKEAIKAYGEYCDAMFPFLEKASEFDKDRDRQRLLEHVKRPMQIDVGSIRAERAAAARVKAAQKFKARPRLVEIPGILRQK